MEASVFVVKGQPVFDIRGFYEQEQKKVGSRNMKTFVPGASDLMTQSRPFLEILGGGSLGDHRLE